MKTYNSLILVSLLSVYSATSQSDNSIYAGLTAGASSYNYNNIDPGTATKVFIGYKVNENIAIEATLFDSGEADITDPLLPPGISLCSDGLNLTAFYRLPTSGGDLTAMVGGGLYSFDTTLKGPGGSISESGSGLSLAAGLEYTITENIALRGDIDMFLGVKDFDQNDGLNSINIGIVLNF
ncbi:MAG: porin family protein [Gammaproteobacteria bacterium]|nr:porin family protein [Gammaproteobacteria bacterium]